MLIREVMTTDLVTVESGATLREVTGALLDNGVGSVVVVDDLDLVGIVTLTDVVYHLSDLRTEAEGLARRHYDWTR